MSWEGTQQECRVWLEVRVTIFGASNAIRLGARSSVWETPLYLRKEGGPHNLGNQTSLSARMGRTAVVCGQSF